MDAIRKKMQSLKTETDSLYSIIAKYEEMVKDANARNDQYECDIRDLGKKNNNYECEYDETNDKLCKVFQSLKEKRKSLRQQKKMLEHLLGA